MGFTFKCSKWTHT